MGTTSSVDESLRSKAVNADDDDGDEVSGPRSEATITLAKTLSRMFPMPRVAFSL